MQKLVTPRVKVNDFRDYYTVVNSLKDGSESWAFVFQDCLDWKKLEPTRMEDWNLRELKGLKFYRLLLVTALLAKLRRFLMQRYTFFQMIKRKCWIFSPKKAWQSCVFSGLVAFVGQRWISVPYTAIPPI